MSKDAHSVQASRTLDFMTRLPVCRKCTLLAYNQTPTHIVTLRKFRFCDMCQVPELRETLIRRKNWSEFTTLSEFIFKDDLLGIR